MNYSRGLYCSKGDAWTIALHGTTQGTDVFERFNKYSYIVTDDDSSIIGTEIGFVGLLKLNNIDWAVLYCSPMWTFRMSNECGY